MKMYEVSKEFEIDYAHRLLGYDGDCARIHGHRAKIIVVVISEELNAEWKVVDFKDIKEAMESVSLPKVPLLIDVLVGPNWGAMKKI